MTLEEARRIHPDCELVRLRYLVPLLPHFTLGFECFIAVPRTSIAEVKAGKRQPPLAPYREGNIIEVKAVQ